MPVFLACVMGFYSPFLLGRGNLCQGTGDGAVLFHEDLIILKL